MNLEAEVIGVPTGVQDYRPAVYGGIAAIEMGPQGVTRKALTLDVTALEKRVVLIYTGQSRESGTNNWDITKRHLDGDPGVRELFDGITNTAMEMRQALEAENWVEVARQINREWKLRNRRRM